MVHSHRRDERPSLCAQVMAAGLKDLRVRIDSVKNTKKITDALKLVAAAKVRRAQDAVVNGRPFAENLVKVTPPPFSKRTPPLARPTHPHMQPPP